MSDYVPLPGAVKLGRIRPKAPPQALRLAVYFDPALMTTPPPTTLDYSPKAAAALSHMYLNNQYGCCVIAGKYHAVGTWTGNDAGMPAVGTDQEVLQQYHAICGPGDNGCVITDVLDVMKARGLPLAGVLHKIDGYVSVNWSNRLEVEVALYLFGALTLGINLPQAWTTAAVWDVTSTQIVGGHDVTAVGYNEQGVLISSWGKLFTITWAALTSRTWIEECYALLSPDWYGSDKLAPCGVDAATLADDLSKLGGGTIPPINPTPAPPTPPVPPDPWPPIPAPPPPPAPLPPAPVFLWTWNERQYAPVGSKLMLTVHKPLIVGRRYVLADVTGTNVTADFESVRVQVIE